MKAFVQIGFACALLQLAIAGRGPIAEPVCDLLCRDTIPTKENNHIPYTTDCTKFCHCTNNGNWKKHCPPGLHFDPKMSVCASPESAGCTFNARFPFSSLPQESQDPIRVGPTGPEPVNPIDPEPEEHSNPSKQVPSGCEGRTCNADDCFEWANSNNCQAYCDCDHSNVTSKTCSDGLYFNPATRDCDWPSNVDCEVPTITPNGCEDVACNGDDCFKIVNTLECNKYCDCDHGNVTIGSCAKGLHFNPEIGACDFPANANCEANTGNPKPGESEEKPGNSNEEAGNGGEEESSSKNPGVPGDCSGICPDILPIRDNLHLAYPWDCAKFCHCANDGHWLKPCPGGLYFNAKLQICDWPQNANCKV